MYFYETKAEQQGCCYFKQRSETRTLTHFHGSPEFLFVKEGEIEVTIGSETRVLHGGEACFCDGYVMHSYTDVTDNVAYVLLGDKEYIQDLFGTLGGKVPPVFFAFDDFPLLCTLLALCEKERENEAGRALTLEGASKILISELAETVEFVARGGKKQDKLISEILRYADENLSAELSLQSIADRVGYSHEHLSRLLHKHLNENWNAFLGRLRVHRAHELLKERPDCSVLKIAYDCGFQSSNTFYRAYKREFGTKPRQRRERSIKK